MGARVIRAAEAPDRAAVEALLIDAGLPIDGVVDHFGTFFVADEGGRVVAAAGLELYGEDALLRSVVVAMAARGTGLGSTLTHRALDEACARGARAVYLLTTTAETFFTRLGFERVPRDRVPEQVRASRELQGACPASATVMRRG
jgi:amino-acid N-acetyltransferase